MGYDGIIIAIPFLTFPQLLRRYGIGHPGSVGKFGAQGFSKADATAATGLNDGFQARISPWKIRI